MPALLIGLAMACSMSAVAEPFVPARDDQVLERIPARLTAAIGELRSLRRQSTREPKNLRLATQLARRYIEIGRAEFDPRYFGYAQAALAPWLSRSAPPAEALVLGAILKQQRHDFDGALTDFEAVLHSDPRNAQAWLSSATILQIQGKHAEAMAHCASLALLPGGGFSGAVCLGRSLGRSGQAGKAYRLVQARLEAEPDARARDRLWALTVLAETAALQGRDETAERHFVEGLSLGLRDSYLLAAFADFLLDQAQPERVRRLLADETRIDGLLLRLALAEQQLGLPTDARIATLSARFAASRRRGDNVHLGEEARFTLHLLRKPRAALELALANWAVQREPRDARIVLEAALAAGNYPAALPVIESIERSSPEDVRLIGLADRLRRLE